MSASPVPSLTLQITKTDADRFLEASQALEQSLRKVLAKDSSSNDSDGKEESIDKLWESLDRSVEQVVSDAAQQCEHATVKSVLERLQGSNLSAKEQAVATIVLVGEGLQDKLSPMWSILKEETSDKKTDDKEMQNENSSALDRQGAVALFRSILSALSSCVHTPSDINTIIVEGKPKLSPERAWHKQPAKKQRNSEETASTTQAPTLSPRQEFKAAQATSFDSSLATLRDEDDAMLLSSSSASVLQREIGEIATHAADEWVHHVQQQESPNNRLTKDTLQQWIKEGEGHSIVPWMELLQIEKWKEHAGAKKEDDMESPASLTSEGEESPTLISFDFSGSESSRSSSPTSLCITISEDNIQALRYLVTRTGLMHRQAADVCKVLLSSSRRQVSGGVTFHSLYQEDFCKLIEKMFAPDAASRHTEEEREFFDQSLLDFFSIYQAGHVKFGENEADLKEVAVGMCFFCSGNKSTKLATGFELLDDKRRGFLTEQQLLCYLKSYLLALVALSVLLPMSKHKRRRIISPQRRKEIRAAVESGAKWTMSHFLNFVGNSEGTKNRYSFESFATWYSTGGYNVAPWLELLDLGKVFSLLNEPSTASPLPLPAFPQENPAVFQTADRVTQPPRDRMSSLRRHHSARRGPPPEVLYSFPLASGRFLVVLKEDAHYVRDVVEQLGLLSSTPDDVWNMLSKAVAKRRKPNKEEVAIYVNTDTFVKSMQDICARAGGGRKRSAPGRSPSDAALVELLSNFFQCFDVDQSDRVALDELMGGLSLLCGGKKSMKLAFAFGLFDTRPGFQNSKKSDIAHSLSGEDLFLFLRSILIVTFSCCRQSLDMADDVVGRSITDTANLICNDVMRHQWETKHSDRLNFDEFGKWYNDGGFERAPWLELLDLTKWVMIKEDTNARVDKHPSPRKPVGPIVPPPPPEDALDPSFFDDNGLMTMDSIDEMDMMLMPQPSTDREIDGEGVRLTKSFSFSSPTSRQDSFGGPIEESSVNFHLPTEDSHGGYSMAISRVRVEHLCKILRDSGLRQLSVEECCNVILSKSARSSKSGSDPSLTKKGFDDAMNSLIKWGPGVSNDTKRTLADILDGIFAVFDRDGSGKASVVEVACGMTVLCQGKKSDKLEFAFEVLDKNKRGELSHKDMVKYLQSFLTVLLNIPFSTSLANDANVDSVRNLYGDTCERDVLTIRQAVKSGAEWAATQASGSSGRKRNASMSFNQFAEWYTKTGYGCIPWLELIDLRKWVIVSDQS